MKYEGIEILAINPVVYLGEEFKDKSFKYNEEYFKEKIKDLKFSYSFSYECPIEDVVVIGFDYEDNYNPFIKAGSIRRIITTVNELSNVLGENVKVQILLSDYFEETANCMQMNLEEMTNCIDMELTEFMKYLYEEIEKLNLKN